jgi:hypothetical protein
MQNIILQYHFYNYLLLKIKKNFRHNKDKLKAIHSLADIEIVTPRGSVEIAFLTVARGPPASQTYPLICPTKNRHCIIDERIVVTRHRVLEPSISDRYF